MHFANLRIQLPQQVQLHPFKHSITSVQLDEIQFPVYCVIIKNAKCDIVCYTSGRLVVAFVIYVYSVLNQAALTANLYVRL